MADGEVVIVGTDGVEHVFPPGFDPVKASVIVKTSALKTANEKRLASPSTYDEGVQQWWQQHPNTTRVVRGTLDTLPAVGAMVGGAAATPETLGAGTAVGAALGAGAGRGVRDLIAEHLGIDSPTSPLSKASRIALDTAITAAVPAVASTAKRFLTDPKTTFADLIETVFHPQGTADKVVDYLRTSTPPANLPNAAQWSTPNAAEPFKLADGSWGYRSIATGEPLAEGTSANIFTKSGKTFTTTVPALVDPAADVRQANLLMGSGMSPSAAALKVAAGNSSRFSAIMADVMKSRMVK